jgi:intracellular multiplication protein IcmJ
MPQALHLDVQVGAFADGMPAPTRRCAFCAWPGAFQSQDGAQATCALCWLVRDLGRPRIDEEARLIWLPEAGQSVINILCREIHIELYRLLEPLSDDAVPHLGSEATTRLYYARVSLAAREDAAVSRLGSSKPSELAEALRQLPAPIRVRQSDLLAGLRLLPRGRFFVGDEDMYPRIVGAWSNAPAVEPRPPYDEISV